MRRRFFRLSISPRCCANTACICSIAPASVATVCFLNVERAGVVHPPQPQSVVPPQAPIAALTVKAARVLARANPSCRSPGVAHTNSR